MADKNIKRLGLYFNLDENEDREMYEFLCTKKKSRYLKRLIENDMNNNNFISSQKQQVKNDESLDDLDIDNNFMSF